MASTRVLLAAVVGVLAGVVTGLVGSWDYAPAIAWDLAASTFLVWTWVAIGNLDATETARHATQEDPTKRTSELIMLGAAVASLFGVGYLLVQASRAKGFEQGLVAGIGVLSVAVSWLIVHTLFTLGYARLYYEGRSGSNVIGTMTATADAGVDFNQEPPPRYADFAYLAFTIGMTFQVSDTPLTNQRIRATALRHALLSYVFGSLILAATVNLVASLASSSQ
jgi:uncharacterized membrane protein